MPINKNALIRYRTIDRALQNHSRKWTLADLIDACSDALYELEGKDTYVSKRTVQLDIQMLRSNKLGYEAPIEVYDRRYYRYADPDYSITNVPLTATDLDVLTESVTVLRQFKDFSLFSDLNGVIQKLEDKIYRATEHAEPIIHLDKNERLTGLRYLDVLYQAISKQIVVDTTYQSFKAKAASTFSFHPYILKEFNNRWFLIGRRDDQARIHTLALDRITLLRPNLKVDYRRDNFRSVDYYKDTIGVTVLYERPRKVLLWVDAANLPYILTKPLHHSQELREQRPDGSGVIQLTVQHNYELERLLLGFGPGITVLGPPKIRRSIRRALEAAVNNYEDRK
ncbi:helix-turn-helix transcriptional regulator [Neolewinella antarctica]|uniref:DNA-binding transcriptional regulator YafY n=1 Tax=Neolewinella antarctica TaxID=442734 RepID=A0ABX0X759_9BACT|nr:WYL domain-containing protein [Neolewinella antarctica]NJC24890.1 putative DNA-binding transcriptional regulator YafY [Neolewinella antarctica]